MARPTNESKKQLEALKSFTEEQLREVAGFLGVKPSDVKEDTTRDELLELISSAKNKNAEVATPAVIGSDGQKMDCPKGHAIIEVIPKSGNEYGRRSRETFFVAVQGVSLVGQRGRKLLIKEKFLNALQLATKIVYDQDWDDDQSQGAVKPGTITSRVVHSEEYKLWAHNPDLEALAEAEADLIRGAEEYQQAKKFAKLKEAMFAKNLMGV